MLGTECSSCKRARSSSRKAQTVTAWRASQAYPWRRFHGTTRYATLAVACSASMAKSEMFTIKRSVPGSTPCQVRWIPALPVRAAPAPHAGRVPIDHGGRRVPPEYLRVAKKDQGVMLIRCSRAPEDQAISHEARHAAIVHHLIRNPAGPAHRYRSRRYGLTYTVMNRSSMRVSTRCRIPMRRMTTTEATLSMSARATTRRTWASLRANSSTRAAASLVRPCPQNRAACANRSQHRRDRACGRGTAKPSPRTPL